MLYYGVLMLLVESREFPLINFGVCQGSVKFYHVHQFSTQFRPFLLANFPGSSAPGAGDGPGPPTRRANAELPGAAAAERHSPAWRCAAGLAAQAIREG